MNSMTDPGPAAKAYMGAASIEQLRFEHDGLQRVISEGSQALQRVHSGGSAGFQRQISGEGKRTLFLHDARQLAATSPCSPEELSVVSVLNRVMLEDSRVAWSGTHLHQSSGHATLGQLPGILSACGGVDRSDRKREDNWNAH
eukprot:g3824.t1